VDGAGQIEEAWFDGDETVLITAGASAPEVVVQDCVEHLKRRYGARIQERSIRGEDVVFPLPKPLRGVVISDR
jgi:4-hydroxy-3-methylbut-2-enyl diphosphate reductase